MWGWEGFALAHSLRVQSITAGRWGSGSSQPQCTQSGLETDQIPLSDIFLLSMQPWLQAQRTAWLPFRVERLISVSLIKIIHYSKVQKLAKSKQSVTGVLGGSPLAEFRSCQTDNQHYYSSCSITGNFLLQLSPGHGRSVPSLIDGDCYHLTIRDVKKCKMRLKTQCQNRGCFFNHWRQENSQLQCK